MTRSLYQKGYTAPKPKSNNYFKFEDGENRVRILSQAIAGWEDWTEDKKPVRYHFDDKPEESINPEKPMKHFVAFIVWNYESEKIQIMQITQASVRKRIDELYEDSDWGAPFDYDLKIVKTGEKFKTKYTVSPVPHKPVSSHIIEAFKERPIYLDALYDNDDPFQPSDGGEVTHGCFEEEAPSAFSDEQDEEDEIVVEKEKIAPKKAASASSFNAFLDQFDDEIGEQAPMVHEFVEISAKMSNQEMSDYMNKILTNEGMKKKFVATFEKWATKIAQARQKTA